jgi:pyruvate/2-oxoglutarate dehydrogenase complex dihydrolipoamide dehydrogenase (E3) component
MKISGLSDVSSKGFKEDHTYDAVVIGGGTGGLSFAIEAKRLGLDVIVFDHVSETPNRLRNTWGLGGTCVNVGCIPKKLFHNSGLI